MVEPTDDIRWVIGAQALAGVLANSVVHPEVAARSAWDATEAFIAEGLRRQEERAKAQEKA